MLKFAVIVVAAVAALAIVFACIAMLMRILAAKCASIKLFSLVWILEIGEIKTFHLADNFKSKATNMRNKSVMLVTFMFDFDSLFYFDFTFIEHSAV